MFLTIVLLSETKNSLVCMYYQPISNSNRLPLCSFLFLYCCVPKILSKTKIKFLGQNKKKDDCIARNIPGLQQALMSVKIFED